MRYNDEFQTIYDTVVRLANDVRADAVLVLVDGEADWKFLHDRAGDEKVVVAVEE